MGTGTLTLSDDDHCSVCDSRRVFAHRLKKSLHAQEPHLVHRVVERGSWDAHVRSGPERYGRARSPRGRCTCAHYRCDHTCSTDAADGNACSVSAADRASLSVPKHQMSFRRDCREAVFLLFDDVRFWPIADMPKFAINVSIGRKADMPFCAAKCLLLTQSGHERTSSLGCP